MTKIRFDNGNTVTIRDGWVQASPPELTAIIDALVATLPGYGRVPFILDEDFNIAQGLIRMAGAGKIVRRDRCRPYRQPQSCNPENLKRADARPPLMIFSNTANLSILGA
jgi:hypothetical protein